MTKMAVRSSLRRRPAPVSAPPPKWRVKPIGKPPRVLVLADVPNWAWARKAAALKAHLAGRVDVTVMCSTDPMAAKVIRDQSHDLYHTFEVCQIGSIPAGWPMTTGITAHVVVPKGNYTVETIRDCASRSVGFHANSLLLKREMEAHLRRPVYYVPNGVDETFFRRVRPRKANRLVVGYVARPNPRKGAGIVEEACKRAGVELRAIVKTWRQALTAEQMREWYQDIHVLAVSSDMDGTPNPALEAAACECAVVTNPIGNMPEFIRSGINGIMTERTVDSLAAALSSLASRPLPEVEAMGRAARETIVREWTWKHKAIAYAEMWERCLGAKACMR